MTREKVKKDTETETNWKVKKINTQFIVFLDSLEQETKENPLFSYMIQ